MSKTTTESASPESTNLPRIVLIVGIVPAVLLLLGIGVGIGVAIGISVRPASVPVAVPTAPAAPAAVPEPVPVTPAVPVEKVVVAEVKPAVKVDAGSVKEKIVGKWEAGAPLLPGWVNLWEFKADGTGNAGILFFGGTMEWSMEGEICNIDINGERTPYRPKFEGDKLILTPVIPDAAAGISTHVMKRFTAEREAEIAAVRAKEQRQRDESINEYLRQLKVRAAENKK